MKSTGPPQFLLVPQERDNFFFHFFTLLVIYMHLVTNQMTVHTDSDTYTQWHNNALLISKQRIIFEVARIYHKSRPAAGTTYWKKHHSHSATYSCSHASASYDDTFHSQQVLLWFFLTYFLLFFCCFCTRLNVFSFAWGWGWGVGTLPPTATEIEASKVTFRTMRHVIGNTEWWKQPNRNLLKLISISPTQPPSRSITVFLLLCLGGQVHSTFRTLCFTVIIHRLWQKCHEWQNVWHFA